MGREVWAPRTRQRVPTWRCQGAACVHFAVGVVVREIRHEVTVGIHRPTVQREPFGAFLARKEKRHVVEAVTRAAKLVQVRN